MVNAKDLGITNLQMICNRPVLIYMKIILKSKFIVYHGHMHSFVCMFVISVMSLKGFGMLGMHFLKYFPKHLLDMCHEILH